MASAIVRVGVGVIVTNNLFPKCVLVGVRKGVHGSGKLSAPGGHLELFETWESCAIREVKEETNLDIENVRFINVTVSYYAKCKIENFSLFRSFIRMIQ